MKMDKSEVSSSECVARVAGMAQMARVAGRTRMAQMARVARISRVAPILRSGTLTMITCATAIGLVATISLGVLGGCASDRSEDPAVSGKSQTEHAGAENTETASESEGENLASESDEGEESGDLLALDETYDLVRKGARLILRYDASNSSFVGTVQNTTGSVLEKVRVEVHLSNGTELGPTTPVDLEPGESAEVSLAATEAPFTGWTPHAEVGEGEHGSGSEGGGEHGEGGEGEHGGGSGDGEGGGEHGSDGGGEGGEGGGEHRSGGEGGEGGSSGEHGGGGEEGGEHDGS